MREEQLKLLLDSMVGKSFLYNGTVEQFEKYEINFEKKWVVVTTSHAAFRRHPLINIKECLSEYRTAVAAKEPESTKSYKTPVAQSMPVIIQKINPVLSQEQDYLKRVFFLRFGSEHGTCLVCESCRKLVEFKRMPGFPYYQCPVCFFELYPAKDTIFWKSSIPISVWLTGFDILSRQLVSAKDLSAIMRISRNMGMAIRRAFEVYSKTGSIMRCDHD